MEKKRWLTGRKVAGIVFLLFLIDASCFGAWYAINNPPVEEIPAGAIRVGCAVDSTHYSGLNMKRGVEMAVDEINALGGVDVGGVRREFFLVVEETEEMKAAVGVEKTVSAVTKLVTTHKVNLVIGGYATPMPALEVACRYKTIYICPGSPVCSETVLTNYDKYKYVFQTVPNSTTIGMWMVDFYTWLKEEHGFTKVAIIAEEYIYVDHILGYFEEHTPEGMEIVYKVRVPSTATTFMPYLETAKDEEAELIMPIIALEWGVTYIKEWQKMKVGLSAGLLVTSERSTYWEETDGACKYHVECQTAIPKPNITEKTFPFYSAFEERYGEHPMYVAEFAYAGVWAYKEAVERAGTLESDAVVAELEKTDMITPYSRLAFHKHSHSGRVTGYWPHQFSQWMGPDYRPAIWAVVDSFTTDDYTCEPIAYADLTFPPWQPPPT